MKAQDFQTDSEAWQRGETGTDQLQKAQGAINAVYNQRSIPRHIRRGHLVALFLHCNELIDEIDSYEEDPDIEFRGMECAGNAGEGHVWKSLRHRK